MVLTQTERAQVREDLEILGEFYLEGIECRQDAQEVRSRATLLLAELSAPEVSGTFLREVTALAARAARLAGGEAGCSGRVADPYDARPWALAGFCLVLASLGTLAWSLR